MPIKTSTTGYIIINKPGYEREPAIPTGKVNGDTAEVYAFMSRHPERFVWIKREDILIEEHLKQQTLI